MIYLRFQKPDRRVVVAMIYWEQMANNVYSQEWYQDQIELAIQGELNTGNYTESRSSKELPNSQSGLTHALSCMTSSYKQAALNDYIVGNVVGEFVKQFKHDFSSETNFTTYCIGLSLGGHLCGFIGKTSKVVSISNLEQQYGVELTLKLNSRCQHFTLVLGRQDSSC